MKRLILTLAALALFTAPALAGQILFDRHGNPYFAPDTQHQQHSQQLQREQDMERLRLQRESDMRQLQLQRESDRYDQRRREEERQYRQRLQREADLQRQQLNREW